MDDKKMEMMARSISAGVRAISEKFGIPPADVQETFAIAMASCVKGHMSGDNAEEVDEILGEYLKNIGKG